MSIPGALAACMSDLIAQAAHATTRVSHHVGHGTLAIHIKVDVGASMCTHCRSAGAATRRRHRIRSEVSLIQAHACVS